MPRATTKGINLPDNSPLRAQLRDYLAKQNIAILPELKRFYRRHMAGTGPRRAGSFAVHLLRPVRNRSARFRTGERRDVEVPPDAMAIADFTPLLIDFYQQAKLDELWQKVRPAYEKELDKYHAPDACYDHRAGWLPARARRRGYLGRRFQIFIDLLGAPEQVQTRNYGDDAFVIVTPSEKPRMYDIRHAYLHFELDPIMIKYGMDLEQKRSLLDLVQLAPLEDNYKSDFVLLANESLIKAVECRLDKNRAGIEQAMRQGYVLTQYFSEQLAGVRASAAGHALLRRRHGHGIDLKRESRVFPQINFDSGPAAAQGKAGDCCRTGAVSLSENARRSRRSLFEEILRSSARQLF